MDTRTQRLGCCPARPHQSNTLLHFGSSKRGERVFAALTIFFKLASAFFFNYYEDPTVSTSASCKRFPLLNVRGIELPDFVQKFEVIFVACPVDFGLITSG